MLFLSLDMRIIIISLLFYFPYNSYACHCGWVEQDMQKVFQKYSFIAHVKIKTKSVLDIKDSSLVGTNENLNQYSKISIEIIELVKGKPEIMILEWGVNTSCDMGIRENDEWILFGNRVNDNFSSVGYCNNWIKMKSRDGERYGQYDSGISAMKGLRKLAGLPEKKNPDGVIKTFYASGNLLAIEQFVNGELHGNRKVYYSNGVLMEESKYVNGVLNGTKKSYAKHGQLLNELIFLNGEVTYSVYWFDTTFQARRMEAYFLNFNGHKEPENIPPARIQKQSEGWFDLEKKNRHSKVYFRSGQKEWENFSFNEDANKLTCEYFESGNLKLEGKYYKQGDISMEKGWNEYGILVSDKKWIAGKYIGDLLKN